MKPIIAVAFSALFSSYAVAFDFENCHVVEIVVHGDQNAHVQLDCTVNNAPACATANTYFGFDKSTPAGKQLLAMVMTAQASGASLTGLVDPNVCSPFQGNVALLIHLRVRR
jgi:hypothetical protein